MTGPALSPDPARERAPVLRVDDVVAGYDGRPVLHRVSLRVARGEVVAVLGANGSGKSTLIRAVLGLVRPSAGSVRLFGVPAPASRQRHRIGYVPQRVGAGSGVPATVAEVVRSGRLAGRGPLALWRPADRAAVARAIATVGLAGKAAEPVAALSGGQQQRVLIARALVTEPDLLILDEPTTGVDAASQQTFAKTLERFTRDGGAVLLVAHELGPLAPLVARAVVLHQGRVVYDGPAPPAGVAAHTDHDDHDDHLHPHPPAGPPGMAPQAPPGAWQTPGERP